MKHSITALTLGASILALGGTACEARNCDSTDRVEVEEGDKQSEEGACKEIVLINAFWNGEDVEDAVAYQDEGNISISGGNGTITVLEGDTDEIGIIMKPGVARPDDTCDGEPETDSGYCAEIDDDLAGFEPVIEEDADGNWLIQAVLNGRSTLRADITVWLPTTFNGYLEIDQGNGDVDVEGVQDAWGIDINNTGAGDITLDSSGAADEVLVENDGAGDCDLNVNGASKLDVFCKVGDVYVGIGAVPTGDDNRYIGGGLGTIEVTFPNTDQAYFVQAVSLGEPITVNAGSCDEERAADTSLSVFCNDANSDDPHYYVETDSSLTDITLNF